MGALSLSSSSSSSSSSLPHLFPTKPPLSSITLLYKPPLFLPFQSSSLRTLFPSLSHPLSSSIAHQNVVIEKDSESNYEETQIVESRIDEVGEVGSDCAKKYQELVAKLPTLSNKEKKELASYANSLGKKLKSQQVGKSGVTDAVATALVETLEANELLKVKIHSNSPAELDDAIKQLEGATGSVAVSQIGRTVILYRPSLTKLKVEENKLQNRRVFLRRQQAYKSSLQTKAQAFVKSRAQASGHSGASRGRRSSSSSF